MSTRALLHSVTPFQAKLPLQDLADWLFLQSKASGLYVECALHNTTTHEMGFRKGVPYEEFVGEDSHVALRILDRAGREGLSQHCRAWPMGSKDVWVERLSALFDQAKFALGYAERDVFRAPPFMISGFNSNGKAQNLKILDAAILSPKILARGRGFLEELQAEALKIKKIREVLSLELALILEKRALVTSLGIQLEEESSTAESGIVVVAQSGAEVKMAQGAVASRAFVQLLREMPLVAKKTAHLAASQLNASRIPSQRCPVVFDSQVGEEILDLLSGTFCADSVQKKGSRWAGKLGSSIASGNVSLRDDGRLLGGVASSLWDAEGFNTSATLVVDKGILQSYLYDTYTSRVDGTLSTGNAGRMANGSLAPQPSNFYMLPGDQSLQEVLSQTHLGLYLVELMGLHTIDLATGDFSLAGAGFMIEKGAIGAPVDHFSVSGNLYGLLKRVDAIANDLKFCGATTAPSFRVEYLDIGGAS